MENASKALVMAGGILLAILLITLLINSFSNIKEFQSSQFTEEEQEQIAKFNSQYVKLLNEYVYGQEILSLKNKEKSDGLVTVTFEGTYDEVKFDNVSLKHYFDDPPNKPEVRYYKCTEITYNESTGRVNGIKFKQIKLTS